MIISLADLWMQICFDGSRICVKQDSVTEDGQIYLVGPSRGRVFLVGKWIYWRKEMIEV